MTDDHPASAAPGDLIYYNSVWKLIGLLLMTFALVGCCWFCTTLPGRSEQVIGWCGLVFFGLGLIVIPPRFRQTRIPQLEFTAEGIYEHQQGFGLIPWDDIRSMTVWRRQSVRLLCLETRTPELFLARLSPVRQKAAHANFAVGASEVTLNFAGLQPGISDAILYCEAIGYEIAYR